MTMVIIGYDRYNVIVKGFNGVKINAPKAIGILIVIWGYGVIGCIPPFLGWGGYALGMLSNPVLVKCKNRRLFSIFQRASW